MIKRLACDINDYRNFFALTELDLVKKIIEFDGAFNSFNYDMTKRQLNVLSCDACYSATLLDLQKQEDMLEHHLQNALDEKTFPFSFHTFANFEVMLAHQRQVSANFFADYSAGITAKRYLTCTLEQHQFASRSFELLLLHYLFAQETLTLEHVFAKLEAALQLAPEIRVFPLLNEHGQHSALLAPLCLLLQQNGFGVELKKVDFEWQTQGHVLLIVREQFCTV